MAAGDASQTTLVQIMHVFLLCYFTQIESSAILIPVSVVLVNGVYRLINSKCKQFKW